jgi:hypothetical protein
MAQKFLVNKIEKHRLVQPTKLTHFFVYQYEQLLLLHMQNFEIDK